MDLGEYSWVEALAVCDDCAGGGAALFAGGGFRTAGAVTANGIAKWDGAVWSALDDGMRGGDRPTVLALAAFDDGSGPALYAGGAFTTAGGTAVSNIARWSCASCYPDCDGDEQLTLSDFLCFQSEFAAMTAYADCDDSGGHDFFDFLCFQNAFAGGCP